MRDRFQGEVTLTYATHIFTITSLIVNNNIILKNIYSSTEEELDLSSSFISIQFFILSGDPQHSKGTSL